MIRSALLLPAAAVLAAAPQAYAADRDALRHIVQDECLLHWRAQHEPTPCEQVVLPHMDVQRGYAVLADSKGGAHLLLIPTRTVSGIEDSALLLPQTPNYFAAAWAARMRLDAVVGHPLRRDAIGLAVNSALARGQDQLHIHMECLRPAVYRALHSAAADAIGSHWAVLAVEESPFRARRLMGQDLGTANPFVLLADALPEARHSMGNYTVVVAGMEFKEGPGFMVLAGPTPTRQELLRGVSGNGLVAPGETLLDASCAVD
jgi:CDP-diacylglycerol pyrophosphatase